MDQQLKKGFLEHVVLKAIEKEDSYGYKIIQDVKDIVEISESTLYPILKRLEVNQFVKTYQVEFNSRLRKYYQITSKGKQVLESTLTEYQSILDMIAYILGEI